MSDKKMTAIEWLQSIEMERDLTLGDWSKAKEMEKEQIKDAFDYGLADGFDDAWYGDESIDSTQYYEETYEK